VNPAGSALVYSTFLGGTGADFGYAVNADWAGNIWAGGSTSSQDFPVTKAYQGMYGGRPFDAFVTKLSQGPAESIGVFEAAVIDLALADLISTETGNLLSAELSSAQQSTAAGDPHQTAVLLRAFIASTNNLASSGALHQDNGAELKAEALDIIARL
jgi:hypothetical protein